MNCPIATQNEHLIVRIANDVLTFSVHAIFPAILATRVIPNQAVSYVLKTHAKPLQLILIIKRNRLSDKEH